MAAATRVVHPFRFDELDAVTKGDQKNQPSGGPIYFNYETHPEFGYLALGYPSPFYLTGPVGIRDCKFHTLEQYYQWQKAQAAGNDAASDKIYAVEHGNAAACRALGKSVVFDKAEWDMKKEGMMEAGVFAKFWTPVEGREDLLAKLLQTGDRELVYAIEGDRVWGIGFRPGNAEEDRVAWGQNLLGKVTMEVRRVCRQWLEYRIIPGHYVSGANMEGELFFRRAWGEGKLRWKGEVLEFVPEKCRDLPKDQQDAVRDMAAVSKKHGKNSPMVHIMRSLKESKKFWDENEGLLERFEIM